MSAIPGGFMGSPAMYRKILECSSCSANQKVAARKPKRKRYYQEMLFLRLSTILIICLMICGIQAYASQATDWDIPPSSGSNESIYQTFTPSKSIHPPSAEIKAAVLNTAQNSLSFFLGKIAQGQPEKYGFVDKDELSQARVGTKLIQMYTRYSGNDYPTNVWRVPILLQFETRCFITVTWVDRKWQAVELGGSKLAELLRRSEESDKEPEVSPQDSSPPHQIIIRDYQQRVDYLQSGGEHRETTILKTLTDYPQVIQEQDQWCWAGVATSLFIYFDSPTEQCQVANYTRTVATWHDFGSDDCCVSPDGDCNYWNFNWGTDGSIEDILESMQENVTIENYGVPSKLSVAEIEADLSKDFPFVIRWQWNGGGGHFVVGYHTEENTGDTTNPLLYYMDPWFGEGHKIALYSWVSDGDNHSWSHTNRLTAVTLAGDIDGNHHLEIDDLILSLQIVSEKQFTSPKVTADINEDGKLGLAEALFLLKRLSQ